MDNTVLINAFCEETESYLEILLESISQLRQTPDDSKLIDTVYIKIHTIKGNASFLKFNRIKDINEICEDIADNLREGKQDISMEILDLFEKAVICTKELLDGVKTNQTESELDVSGLLEELKKYQ